MTEKDLEIQDLRREIDSLKKPNATVCTEAVMPRLTKKDYIAIIQWLLKEAR